MISSFRLWRWTSTEPLQPNRCSVTRTSMRISIDVGSGNWARSRLMPTKAEHAIGVHRTSVPWCAVQSTNHTWSGQTTFIKLIQSTLTLWTKQEVSAFDRRKKMLPREAYWKLFKSKSWKQPKWLIYFSNFQSGERYKFRTCDPCSVKTPTFHHFPI